LDNGFAVFSFRYITGFTGVNYSVRLGFTAAAYALDIGSSGVLISTGLVPPLF